MSVTATQSASYISAVGGTVTITPNLTGASYFKVDGGYKNMKLSETYTSPNASDIETTPKYSYSIVGSGASYASVSADGVVSYNTDPGSNMVVTVQVTAWREGFEDYTTTTTCPVTLRSATGNKTGTDGTTVTLDDLEDHTWTYYSGVDESVDGGNYNTNYGYVTTAGDKCRLLYSPNPRNVTIEYDGNGGAVSISENESKFIYYKTLEESGEIGSGMYEYRVISNPFSKRPAGKGFAGWKIISGGEYIKNHSTGDVLALDEKVVFEKLPYPSINCMSATIEFQAQWTTDIRKQVITTKTGNSTITFTDGTYETNFVVMKADVTGTLTLSSPCTVMMVEPDGSADYRDSYTFTGTITPDNTGVSKLEYTKWSSENTVAANSHNVILGRGLTWVSSSKKNCAKMITGANTTNLNNANYRLVIESGRYTYVYPHGYASRETQYFTGTVQADVVFGCDYDRAINNNDNFIITYPEGTSVTENDGNQTSICTEANASEQMTYDAANKYNPNSLKLTIKSGQIVPNRFIEKAGTNNDLGKNYTSLRNCLYIGSRGSNSYIGRRTLIVEGGELPTIGGGGSGEDNSADFFPKVVVRMKGGTVHGSFYGGAAVSTTKADVVFAMTGGKVIGWICGGCNGTSDDGGITRGASYIYVGGNAEVNSSGSHLIIGSSATGGNVFGAGAGLKGATNCGEMLQGTNVVIADQAIIEHGVYGGGSYGYCATDKTATLYMTGGTIKGDAGATDPDGNYSPDIKGGLFGGASLAKGGTSQIYMTGGTVGGAGVYGGSNYSGTLEGNTNVKVVGGTVGSAEATANVHGGGYGSSTIVTGNVDVTIGGTATVNGSVYGGSALGKTNNANTTSSKTKTTTVTMTGGTINGSLFGGGLGSTAAVITNPVVTMSGGTVTQNVFGGGDAAKVDGNTSVTITGTDTKVGNNVYGGGNAAEVTGTTHVQIGEPKK